MKFNVAWAKVAQENSILKTGVLVLGTTCAFLGVCLTQMALRNPLVIERGCFSKAVQIADSQHTNLEIEFFVEAALAQRFDSKDPGRETFLASSEKDLRSKEQKDLVARKLNQRVIVNAVSVSEKGILVEADRLISVGDIRSAFKFPLAVKVESVTRTVANPFGLILSEVKPVDLKEKQ